jgi:hypothetical protein
MKKSTDGKGGRRLGSHPRNGLVGYVALLVAIFAALGGVAVGLPGKGTVTANDLKAGSVTTRAIHRGAVGRGKLGPSAQTMWASVNSDGTVIAQRGGATVSHPGTGTYYISFGKSVANKAINATAQLTIGNGISIIAVPCKGSPVNPGCGPAFDNPETMLVVVRGGPTSAGPGDQANEPFFVTVTP